MAPTDRARRAQVIVSFDGINLGIAAQTDRGLVVPSVRAAEKLGARELDAQIRRLTDVARQGQATPRNWTLSHLMSVQSKRSLT